MSEKYERNANHLIDQGSPYLQQHAYNPVNWYPWGNEALKLAREQNKPMIISIGYSACHWCHVMERESFENKEIASIMNEYFINIKVDREERPDVDQVYMNAVQIMQGNGGWPLNCFALPNGKPFWGGTYFRPEQWKELLEQIQFLYVNRNQELLKQADNITRNMHEMIMPPRGEKEEKFSKQDLVRAYERLSYHYDTINGGSKGAPKFPMPTELKFLLRYAFLNKSDEAMRHVRLSLNSMARGGIYDQLGGGFSRYSTDEKWKVPHFEKMLYDNAQLISLYAEAFIVSHDPFYVRIAEESMAFIQREMMSEDGAFYSALDADSEGKEGNYYVWEEDEIDRILGEDAAWAKDYFRIGHEGLWENGKNILLLNPAKNDPQTEISEKADNIRKRLATARNTRVRPGLDDKVLCSWNGLTCKALSDLYLVTGSEHYLSLAKKNAAFILKHLFENGKLHHSWHNGKITAKGFLEDYAFVIEAFIALYQASMDEKWLYKADELMELALSDFYHKDQHIFYYTALKNQELISQTTDLTDMVIPSSVSVMGQNLHLLALYLEKKEYREILDALLDKMQEGIKKHPGAYTNWLNLQMAQLYTTYILTILGDACREKMLELHQRYYPYKAYCPSKRERKLPHQQNRFIEGTTMIYVCTEETCLRPTDDPETAMKQLI